MAEMPHSYWWFVSLQVWFAQMELAMVRFPINDGGTAGITTYEHHFVAANDPLMETPA